MRNRFGMSVLFTAALTFSLVLLGGVAPSSKAMAQGKDAKGSMAFNPHDLSGVWEAPVRVTTGKEHSSFTKWGEEQYMDHKPFNAIKGGRIVPLAESNDPMIVCDPLGFPRNIFYEIRHMEFIQGDPGRVVQLLQYQRIWRQIWTDGRKLPTNVGQPGGPDLRYYGYSVGHWDGNTFVVETTGLTPATWIDVYGNPHSAEMKVEERYTRLDHGHLKLTVMITDPKTYTKPFVALNGLIFRLATKAGVTGQIAWPNKPFTLPEQMCVPSEALTYLKVVAETADGDKVMSPFLMMPK